MKIRCKKCNGSITKKQNKSINYVLFIISLILIIISIICNIFIDCLPGNIIFVLLFSCLGMTLFCESIFYKEMNFQCTKCGKWGCLQLLGA